MSKLILSLCLLLILPLGAQAACLIQTSSGAVASAQGDVLFQVLSRVSGCPTSVQDLKRVLAQNGFPSKASMVANRGIHNARLGSFSLFEVVTNGTRAESAEIFFGHFTRAQGGQVELDQRPTRGQLMIELIAWDAMKGLYNFYEMIGDGAKGVWFYRGDSADILADNAGLHLTQPPKFGNRLRCSGCHSSGGPIMKELALPHNDWWTRQRPLPLAPNQASSELASEIAGLLDAKVFAEYVRDGIVRLEKSATYQRLMNRRSRKELLRPLFCEVEINLESDTVPLGRGASLAIPSSFFVHPWFGMSDPLSAVPLSTSIYGSLLKAYGAKFPEIDRPDADHGWLTPVKGQSDLLAIRSLIASGHIDAEFVADVLAIDLETPIFSAKRCALLSLVPDGANWQARLVEALKVSSLPGAREWLENRQNPAKNLPAHLRAARERIRSVRQNLSSPQGARAEFEKLLQVRQAVFESPISKNPRGQILEPGFRVIFPQTKNRTQTRTR